MNEKEVDLGPRLKPAPFGFENRRTKKTQLCFRRLFSTIERYEVKTALRQYRAALKVAKKGFR